MTNFIVLSVFIKLSYLHGLVLLYVRTRFLMLGPMSIFVPNNSFSCFVHFKCLASLAFTHWMPVASCDNQNCLWRERVVGQILLIKNHHVRRKKK